MNTESYLISTLLAYPEYFLDVAEFLRPDDFERQAYGDIFSSMGRLSAKSVYFDAITVKNEMTEFGRAISDSVLVDLLSMAPGSGLTAVEHARIVLTAATRRRTVKSLSEALEAAKDVSRPITEVSGLAERAALEAAENRQSKELRSFDEFMPEVWRGIEAMVRGEITGLKSGFPDIDGHTGGFQKTDFVILGGRPGMFKTSLALEILVNVGLGGGVGAFFELEMTAAQVVRRALYQKGKVNSQMIKRGIAPDRELPKLRAAQEMIRGRKLFFDDSTGLTPLQAMSKCRKLKAKHGRLDLVVIDNVQIMNGDGNFKGDRRAELASVSNNLKRMAKDLETVVIGISHLNRESAKSSDPEPSLHDLKNTGEFEQDADIVILLHIESVYKEVEPGKENDMKVLFAKFREGETGFKMIRVKPEFTSFETMSQRTDEPPPKQKFDRNDWNVQ